MSIRSTAKTTVLSAIVILSGCVTYPTKDEYASALSTAPVLSGGISDQTFTLLEMDEWVEYELGSDANVLDFGNGKTFFAAFEIQNRSTPRRLELRSAFNTIAQARGHVVLPTLLILDADFNPLLEEESDMRQSSAPNGGTEFAHEVDLSADAKYVVIHTDPGNIDREVPWHYSLYIAVPINVGTESNSRAKVGVGGPMRIRISTGPD